jgi:hypothetical protein
MDVGMVFRWKMWMYCMETTPFERWSGDQTENRHAPGNKNHHTESAGNQFQVARVRRQQLQGIGIDVSPMSNSFVMGRASFALKNK